MPSHDEPPLSLEPGHPAPEQLEQLMRGGGLRSSDVQAIVRHLVAGCPSCVAITKRLWKLGSRSPRLEAVLEELAREGGGPAHDEPGLIRRRER